MTPAAKKSLGQHFLLNPSTIDKILRMANVNPSDRILEIGPGPGVMTERLVAKAGQVVVVEKDRRFAARLQTELKEFSNLQIIEGDILKLEIDKTLENQRTSPEGATRAPMNARWKVISNLPYNIATEVIFHLLESSALFDSFYLMVQREVAGRIVAGPGSRKYGILSVFTQLFSENRIVMKLPPGAFTPPPKVHSALVEFRIAEGCRFPIDHLPAFKAIVRAAFGERRKMIRNALRDNFPSLSLERTEAALKRAGIAPSARAETVPIANFVTLANELSSGWTDKSL